MTISLNKPTRRSVLQGMAGAAVVATPFAKAFALPASDITFELDREGGWIHSLVAGKHVHNMSAESPSAMAFAADARLLHVAHAIAGYRGLPTGAVSHYRVHRNGSLALVTTQPLSLAAVIPHHIALSQDEQMLAIAAAEGGILNLLRVDEQRSAHEVIATHRRIGASLPQKFHFDSQGTLCVDEQQYAMLDGRLARIGG